MASRIVVLADAVAAAIVAAYGTPVAPLVVTTSSVYVPNVDPEKLLVNQRRVDVYPMNRVDAGPLSRAKIGVQNRIGVVVYERYIETGTPPKAWMDERLAWVETNIEKVLGNAKNRFLGAYPDAIEIESHSPEQLVTNKLFWSECIVTLMDEE